MKAENVLDEIVYRCTFHRKGFTFAFSWLNSVVKKKNFPSGVLHGKLLGEMKNNNSVPDEECLQVLKHP